MSRRSFPWNVLKVDSSADTAVIRKAYADLLRAMNPDDDPAAFARLRQARDRALTLAKSRIAREEEDARRSERGEAPPGQADAYDDYGDDDWDDAGQHPAPFPDLGDLPTVDAALDLGTGVSPPTLTGFADIGDIVSAQPPMVDADFTNGMADPALEYRAAEPDNKAPALPAGETLAPPSLTGKAHAADTVGATPAPSEADRAAIEARYALDDLIASDKPLDTDEARALLTTVLNDPALERVSERMGVENWLAGAVARNLPRTLSFVRPLADHFGWREEAKTINQSGSVALLADHALAQDFRERLERPDNKGYKAWRAMTTPGPVRWYSRKPPYLTELMRVIREQHPLLERDYDPQRFDYWVGRLGKGDHEGGSNWGWILIGIIVVLVALGRLSGAESESNSERIAREQQEQRAPFDDPIRRRNTIDDVLMAAGGPDLHITAMEAHDPAFVRQLDERFLNARDQLGRIDRADPLLAEILVQRIRGGLAEVRQGDLVAYRSAQASLAEARLAEGGRSTSCNDIIRGSPDNLHLLPLEQREAWQTGQRRMLLGSRALAADQPGGQTFNLLTTTWADARQRARMSEEEFSASFRGDRGDYAFCRTFAALLRTALARPGDPDRLDVLRRL